MVSREFYPIASALNKIAEVTNRKFRITYKVDRIRLQKVVYILKLFNYPSTEKLNYNLYINGPYSRALARLYYAKDNQDFSDVPSASNLTEMQLNFIKEADNGDIIFLEAVVTALDFRRTYNNYEDAVKHARVIKAKIASSTWAKVLEFLHEKKSMLTTIYTQTRSQQEP